MANSKENKRRIEHDIFGFKPRREGINSKQKGNRNELEVCKWLEKWTGEPFTRVPSSGGMRWKNAPNVCGDVVCEDIDFNFAFSVETKHLKKIPLEGDLLERSKVFTIMQQAISDAERANKKPMLILRSNGMPKGKYIVFFQLEDVKLLGMPELVSAGGSIELDIFLHGYASDSLLESPYLYQNLFNEKRKGHDTASN